MVEFWIKNVERKVRYWFLLIHYLVTYKSYSWLINKEINKSRINSIIVVETLKIGDIIVSTPIFSILRKEFPGASICALVLEGSKPVIENNPNVDNIVVVKNKLSIFKFKEFYDVFKLLRIKHFDMGVVLHPASLSVSLLLLFSRIRFRLGCTQAGILNGKGLFLTHKVRPCKEIVNVVEQNIKVLSPLNIKIRDIKTEIFVNKSDEENIIKQFGLNKLHNYICINVCTAHVNQRWNKFPELIDLILSSNKNNFIILIGDKLCENYLESILLKVKNKDRIINVGGKTNLMELFALVKQVSLLISVDGSLPHIAAALDVPSITLYGPGYPEIWRPWNNNAKYLINDEVCTRCRQHFCIWSYLNKEREFECMKSVKLAQVLNNLSWRDGVV